MTTNTITLDLAKLAAFLPAISGLAAAIASAKDDKAKLSEEDKAHNDALASSVADRVRAFAKDTAEAGVSPQEANAMLRQGLNLAGLPVGTALNYGRAVEGFRKIMEANPDKWQTASVKDAQSAMRSEDTVAKDAIRAELKPFLRDATLAQLEAIKAHVDTLGITVKERKVRKDKGNTDAPAEAEAAAEQQAVAA